MRDLVTSAVGLLGGILLSIAFWYVTMHRIVPKVEFSRHISKRYAVNGTVAYEFRIRNRSRTRGIVDLQVSARLKVNSIPMWRYSPGTEPLSVPIPIEVKKIGYMDRRDGFRVIRIDVNSLPESASIHHARALQMHRLVDESNNPLEYLFKTGTEALLTIDLLAYDEWTGARKFFRSSGYTIDDIVSGKFNEKMEVTPFAIPEGPDRFGGSDHKTVENRARGQEGDRTVVRMLLILVIWLVSTRRKT
jgi:hypothetical protein